MVAEVKKRGGILTLEDLAGYQVKVRKPVTGSYRGYTIITAPPPSGGAHVLQLLNIVENFDLKALASRARPRRIRGPKAASWSSPTGRSTRRTRTS